MLILLLCSVVLGGIIFANGIVSPPTIDPGSIIDGHGEPCYEQSVCWPLKCSSPGRGRPGATYSRHSLRAR